MPWQTLTHKIVMEAVIEALEVPRNRMGALSPADFASGEPLRKLAVALGISGGVDRVDQAVNVMRAFLQAEESK